MLVLSLGFQEAAWDQPLYDIPGLENLILDASGLTTSTFSIYWNGGRMTETVAQIVNGNFLVVENGRFTRITPSHPVCQGVGHFKQHALYDQSGPGLPGLEWEFIPNPNCGESNLAATLVVTSPAGWQPETEAILNLKKFAKYPWTLDSELPPGFTITHIENDPFPSPQIQSDGHLLDPERGSSRKQQTQF